jgi:hypothetical protein
VVTATEASEKALWPERGSAVTRGVWLCPITSDLAPDISESTRISANTAYILSDHVSSSSSQTMLH